MMKLELQFSFFFQRRGEKIENSRVISARGIFAEVTEPGSLPIKRGRLVSEGATRGFILISNNQKLRQRRLHFIVSRDTLFRVEFTHSLVLIYSPGIIITLLHRV